MAKKLKAQVKLLQFDNPKYDSSGAAPTGQRSEKSTAPHVYQVVSLRNLLSPATGSWLLPSAVERLMKQADVTITPAT